VCARLKDRIAASDWFEASLRVVVLAVSFVLERFGPGPSAPGDRESKS
jgi:hypothetical protein